MKTTYVRKKTESEILDDFADDANVISVTRMWAAGLYSDAEFMNRMKYLRQCLVELADWSEEVECEGLDRDGAA